MVKNDEQRRKSKFNPTMTNLHLVNFPGQIGCVELYDLFAPVRQGVLESGMTDDEVNQIIDEAIKEVRDERKRKQSP